MKNTIHTSKCDLNYNGGDRMIKARIEYLDFNDHGGISQYAITVKGASLQSIERTFYDRIGGWDAFFREVIE